MVVAVAGVAARAGPGQALGPGRARLAGVAGGPVGGRGVDAGARDGVAAVGGARVVIVAVGGDRAAWLRAAGAERYDRTREKMRAMLAGGGLQVTSGPKGGTEVHAWFPLKWKTSSSEDKKT